MCEQHKTLEFGTEEYNSNSNYGIPIPTQDVVFWQAECYSEIPAGSNFDIPSSSSNNLPGYINFPANSTYNENVEIIHDSFGKAAADQVVSRKLFCFANGHVLDPQRVDLFYLDLSKRAYQVTIHRHNGFDFFSLTKVVDVSDLFQLLKVFLSSKLRLMFLIDDEYLLLTDELNLVVTGQPHLQMEVKLAFSLQNLMRSTMHYAISQAYSSRKTKSQNVKSFVVCECENELFLDHCRENSSQSIQSFIPFGGNIKLSPCRVASVVYSLYLYGEVQENFSILGRVVDVSFSSVKFSYRTDPHSSPGHSQDYHFHGILSLSLLVPTEQSPVEFFEIVYCPQRAHLTSKDQRSPGTNKQKQYGLSPCLDSAVVQSSSNERQMLLEAFEDDAIYSHESQEVVAESQTNIQKKRKKSSTMWTAADMISLEDLQQNYGKKREEAAESLQVSVSTFKRICRKFGIDRWPTAKRNKDKCLFSARKCDAPLIAKVRTSQLLQNGMPCEDRETTCISRPKRKGKEKEAADNIEAINHFEEQPSEIQNRTPKRQAVDCATKDSSCLNSITGYVVDDMVSTRMGVQAYLEAISIEQLNSISCNENTSQNTKLLFDNLIALPLKDLINPEKEIYMKETLCILAENLSFFFSRTSETDS
ncbi:uncharacterized protein LOC107775968 [Nicotiana tabacum]|uniref:Uncharacterized protein LOC107775968 n=1 Tax=Nicotiana tabacum TaxID=4097 RepID=A0A1S3YG55_TOBAC|nr:PREDICTED: uncharacterized protein LOC107775968 [Nicotiana tabacum]